MNFDKYYKSLINNISTIPRNSLDATVFQFTDDAPPFLQPFIKVQIIKDLIEFNDIVAIDGAFMVGKILSKDWDRNTPIKVIVKVHPEDVQDLLTSEEINEFLKLKNGTLAGGTTHPINYYVIIGEYDEDKEPAMYDIGNERWIKEPKMVQESIVDYAHKTLEPNIWDLKKNPPLLKTEIKEKVISLVKMYLGSKFSNIVDAIHITGSIGTQQYKSLTDFDIHIIPKNIKERVKEYEVLRDDIREYFREKKINIAGHPVEMYLQMNPSQETHGDASYDVLNDKWLVEPTELSLNFNPDKEFDYLRDGIKKIFKGMDLAIGELRRDLIDHDNITDYLKHLKPDEKTWVRKELHSKITEIENDIEKLVKEKEKFHTLRKETYNLPDEDIAWSDALQSRSWAPPNVIWKMLDRYKYISLILALQQVFNPEKEDHIDNKEINDIKKDIFNFKEHREYVTEVRRMSFKKKRWKDPLARSAMVMARGLGRKNSRQVPTVSRKKGETYPFINKLLKIAKRSKIGTWKLSRRQVLEIVEKYGLRIPKRTDPLRKLGKTGIMLYRQSPVDFFLIKNELLHRKLTASKE